MPRPFKKLSRRSMPGEGYVSFFRHKAVEIIGQSALDALEEIGLGVYPREHIRNQLRAASGLAGPLGQVRRLINNHLLIPIPIARFARVNVIRRHFRRGVISQVFVVNIQTPAPIGIGLNQEHSNSRSVGKMHDDTLQE